MISLQMASGIGAAEPILLDSTTIMFISLILGIIIWLFKPVREYFDKLDEEERIKNKIPTNEVKELFDLAEEKIERTKNKIEFEEIVLEGYQRDLSRLEQKYPQFAL